MSKMQITLTDIDTWTVITRPIPGHKRYVIAENGEVYTTSSNSPLSPVMKKLKVQQLKYGGPYIHIVSDTGKKSTKRIHLLAKQIWGITLRGHNPKTHCPQGHEYTPENTYQYADGRRCKTCIKLRTKNRSK
jgi:hypothetical protein